MVKCAVCGLEDEGLENEYKYHLHHLIPKFMGGSDKDGRVYLCPKHHNILHGMIPSKIFQCMVEEDKEKCRKKIKSFSLWWIKQGN